MAASDDLELVSLTKNLSSGEEEERFLKLPPRSGTYKRGNTYRPNWKIEKSHNVVKKWKFYLPALCFFALGLTLWIFTLTWIAVRLRIEMQRLTIISNKVL